MRNASLAFALIFCGPAPVMAENWDGLFGLSSSDIQGAMAHQQALMAREAAEREARRQRNLNWGLVVERRYDEGCTLKAVASRMRVVLNPSIPAPEVIYESLAEGWEFRSAYLQAHGARANPPALMNSYFWETNQIFIADGRFSNIRRSVDQAVAGEMANFIQQRYLRARNAIAIEAIKDWFGAEFANKSPCGG